MSKKDYIIFGTIILVLAIIGSFWLNGELKEIDRISYDALKFKSEYEAYNGQINPASDKKYYELTLENDSLVKYSSYEEIFSVLDQGTGVIFLAFPTCPWCRSMLPTLMDSASKAKITILYLNILEDRDILKLNDKGKIITEREGTDNYKQLVSRLDKFLPAYDGLEVESIKRIYMPVVIFIKDGKVLGVEQSLKAYTERVEGDAYLPMNKEENKALAKIFNDYYQKIKK